MSVNRVENPGPLKIARFSITTDSQGQGTYDFKIPGTKGKVERVLGKGLGWFENKSHGDYIKVSIVDIDGVYKEEGTIIEYFYDESVNSSNQGAYVPYHRGEIELRSSKDFVELISGTYLRLEVFKGDGTQDTFRVNLELNMRKNI